MLCTYIYNADCVWWLLLHSLKGDWTYIITIAKMQTHFAVLFVRNVLTSYISFEIKYSCLYCQGCIFWLWCPFLPWVMVLCRWTLPLLTAISKLDVVSCIQQVTAPHSSVCTSLHILNILLCFLFFSVCIEMTLNQNVYI